MSETTQEVIDRLRRLVDDQEGGDAVVLVQRQLFNRTVGRIEAQAKRIAELEAALADLLNDCINFDGGKLTEAIMAKASRVLKERGE